MEHRSLRLDGRVALVTGGGSGIGEASSRMLAAQGARVAVLSRSEDEVREVCDAIRADGGEAMPVAADISRPEAMEEAVGRIIERWGRLDIVFANAGINGVWAPIEDLTPEEWDQTLSVNLKGTFLTIKHAVPALKKQGVSVIVTSSVNGTRMFSNTGATAYSCSEGGQEVLTKMLALELARQRIRVNVICPGSIETAIDENTGAQPGRRGSARRIPGRVYPPDGRRAGPVGASGRTRALSGLRRFQPHHGDRGVDRRRRIASHGIAVG